MRYVDLPIAIENDVASDPGPFRPRIDYIAHHASFGQMAPFFPGLRQDQMPDGEGWAVERLALSTHNGTRMDAPWHFHSTQDAMLACGVRPAETIDQVSLDRCFRPGVKLDLRHLKDGDAATADDVERELGRIGYQLRPLDIVLVNTRAEERYGHPDYVESGCGMGREATLFRTGRPRRGHGRLVLGRALQLHRSAMGRNSGPGDHLGGPQSWERYRLLPDRETARSGSTSAVWLHRLLLSGEDQKRGRWVDSCCRDLRTGPPSPLVGEGGG